MVYSSFDSALAGENSTVDLSYSFHQSKYACLVEWYYIHVWCCHIVYWCGLLAMLVRFVPRLHWTHAYLGRGYVLFMLLSTGSAMLVHNDGLPAAVCVSFVWVLGGMAIGWWLIRLHMAKMERLGMQKVELEMKATSVEEVGPLAAAIGRAKGDIARAKSFKDRMLSYKATHGVVMFLSWFNIAGRIMFSTSMFYEDYTCWTYPAYKAVNANQYQTKGRIFAGTSLEERILPVLDPNYGRLPWAQTGMLAWNIIALATPIVMASLIGYGLCLLFATIENRYVKVAEPVQKEPTPEYCMMSVQLGPSAS